MNKFLLLFALFIPAGIFAQHAPTVHGEVLVQLEQSSSPGEITREVQEVLGMLPHFEVKKLVSDHMHIWLFSFNEDEVAKEELINTLRNVQGVRIAQANHIITERVIPNDPFFGLQWHHVQPEDHDIDTDLAWDITTGGITVNGDEIVVCVVEIGGAKWDIPDLIENHWMNTNEVPGNGIDDDNNGYTDDYDGWNISSDNDNISPADHGTRVNSMIGSRGNDNSGVAGVNWDVKLMQVQIGSATEANVIEGYTYPMIMRRRYNETNGAEGAFVVATNSSWGADGAQPEDAPLWCAMYDSLGYYGVLSCGSTTNANANVDIVGDMPTACPSDYLISVARTNASDVRSSGGYGITTIDIAAPGDNVYLANSTGFGTTTGTSFSGPCVAGAIALLYSAPCTSFMDIAVADPAEAAMMLKSYIMSGVDQTAQLQAELVSGGRLNVNNSLTNMMNECAGGSCIPPFAINVTQQTGTLNYTISWNSIPGMNAFDLQYTIAGSTDSTLITTDTSPITVNDLLACTNYEIRLLTHCDEGNSEWSPVTTFQTDGCCVNPDVINVSGVESTSATLSWNDVLAAEGYMVTITPAGGSQIEFTDIPANSFDVTGLEPCTFYTGAVYSTCAGDLPPPATFSFHTTGCENCNDLEYCTVIAGTESEHIALVIIGDINRSSEADGGYILVEGMTDTLHAAGTYNVTLAPGYVGMNYNENFRVWIDYDSNGNFDEETELVYDAPAATTSTISGSFTVPVDIQSGVVRLRVAMRYAGASALEPTPCGSWQYGEIEDYCVMLDETVGIAELGASHLVIYPNPANDVIAFQLPFSFNHKKITMDVYDSAGHIVLEKIQVDQKQLDVSSLPAGFYSLVLRNGNEVLTARFIKE